MIWRVSVEMICSSNVLRDSTQRYALLDRWNRLSARHGVRLCAFGWGDDVRLVAEGSGESIKRWTKAWKGGFTRALREKGERVDWGATAQLEVSESDVAAAVSWAHLAVASGETSLLASPWSSYRDLLGFRRASFYDPGVLAGRLDPAQVRGGSGELRGEVSALATQPLDLLLRVAAAVLGVPPYDRRCFGVFVKLGKLGGWKVRELAGALIVTERRVRQLLQADCSVGWVLPSLAHPCLLRVP